MAFDGITVAALTKEFNDKLTGGYIQKIAQPETDELQLTIKNNRHNYKLLISASATLPLIHLTDQPKLSPLTAPNFCMLLRKHLGSARILSITQPSLERIVEFHLENLNELGDVVQKKLIVELMGKHSNIILVDENTGLIIDSIKHINGLLSSVREVLPGKEYFIPNTKHKEDPHSASPDFWNNSVFTSPVSISKSIYSNLTGFSASMSQELCFEAGIDGDLPCAALNGNQRSALLDCFRNLMKKISDGDYCPCIAFVNNIPQDFAPVSLSRYEQAGCLTGYDSISEVVESFYREKAVVSRIHQKSTDLRKHVTTLLERTAKKTAIQTKQLQDTQKKDIYKVYGELLNTYGYQLTPDDSYLECVNYYNNETVRIPVDKTMTSTENANRYFNKYNKMKRTFEAVSEQLAESNEMLEHLDSILNELDIARKEEDLQAIRRELEECGYIKKQAGKKGKNRVSKSKPLHFISSDGYDIYVGKNNFQNEEITFKLATGNDWWFHAKKTPGSHVIIKCNNEEPPIRTFEEAASLAAFFSKGHSAEKLEIDYTQKKNIKKPHGSKPGFVVYYTNYSMLASSDIPGIQCCNPEDSVFLERSHAI